MTIALISGALANKPWNGGNAWTRLTWLLGLERLGVDAYFVEQIHKQACTNAVGVVTDFERSENLAFFRHVVKHFGLAGRAALIEGDGNKTEGLSYPQLKELAGAADLLVNISGHLTLDLLKRAPRRKVYFDDDPGYTQFWHANGNIGERLGGHDSYYTIGANIGSPECPIPMNGIDWTPMHPFVVLDQWPMIEPGEARRFTTVASWRGPYGPVQYGGETYGLKVHEFRKFIELPQRVGQNFEIALDIHPTDERDLAMLRQNGWRLVDPSKAVRDPDAYRRYIQESAAEFSAAQGVYVQTRSGWFSDRTACYLASGKPALVQDTGFSRRMSVGEGLIPFRTLAEATDGAEAIVRDYTRHSQAARRVAETYFDSDKVLSRLLDAVGSAS